MTDQPLPDGILSQLSQQLADAVQRTAASIVNVNARPRYGGSGVVWADDIIVTADHVVEREDEISTTPADGQALGATLVGRDPETDLAVLRTTGLTAPAIQKAPSPRVGGLALLVSRPGQSEQASLTVVRSVGDALRRGRRAQPLPLIGIDATFHPGYSGGGLVDVEGRLLGIATSGFGRGRGDGVVVGLSRVEQVVTALLQHGRIRRGYLGITSQPVDIPTSMRGGLGDQTRGLLVLDVAAGSPAERGGMLMGDVLVKIAEEPVQGPRDLRAELTADRVGQTVSVRVLRGGQAQTLAVTIGEQP